jgi:TolB-like protein/class 3 adenylate cyclase/Tfp pilus assembly protein PilF
MQEGRPRRLAAILAADIAGYSALMGADEARTVRDLKQHQAVVLPMIAQFGGRVIDTAGDGILAEFPSVVNAVDCALAFQEVMARRNAAVDAARRMQFRVGINLGDVIYDDSRIYGDGVNVAARLENMAQPGGICLAEDAYRQVRGKLAARASSLGAQRLKNIADPVTVYRVDVPAAGAVTPSRRFAGKLAWTTRARALAAALLVIAVLAGWLAWQGFPPGGRAVAPSALAPGAPPIIAVLPFANQTGDQSQEYFADGLTEEVINALGRFNTLRVIGHNAVLRYKNAPAVKDGPAAQLGASYLVEGSVRRSGNQVRIAAQLIEARAGTVIWSDRFDGGLADVFDFQETIARRIAGTLAANVSKSEVRRSLDQPKPDPSAFDLVLRARAIGATGSRSANRRFREQIAEAIKLDPGYATAHALLAEALYGQAILGWTEFADRDLSHAAEEARKAIALRPDEPDGYRALGRILLARTDYEQAEDALKRAVEINPSDASALAAWGSVQSFSGRIPEGIESLQLALKLDPSLEPNFVFDLAVAYYLARRHEDALRVAEGGIGRYPDFPMFNAVAAAAAARLGRKAEAGQYAEVLHRRLPVLDTGALGSRFKDPAYGRYLREGLQLAGF